uniref:Uncharacterized protein n=1 Tax=Marseillevirus LCMAC201 TaxID=2506605 RepID=A0A481YXH6_9VIRU|nr:MAG: uncharacterized protein LCMAC201_00980 [Marseillevirus LCMAC201]
MRKVNVYMASTMVIVKNAIVANFANTIGEEQRVRNVKAEVFVSMPKEEITAKYVVLDLFAYMVPK